MKKILVFSHAAILEVNRTLFENLAALAPVEITLVAPRNWKGDLIENLVFQPPPKGSRIQFVTYPVVFSGRGSFFFYRAHVRDFIQRIQPDILFLDEEPWSLSAYQSWVKNPSFKQVFYTKQNIYKKLPPPFSWIQNHTFRHSTLALTVSQECTDVLQAKGFQAPVHILPHSYDEKLFHPIAPAERARLRSQLGNPLGNQLSSRLGISPEATVISYFGRLTSEKGLEDLLTALTQVVHSTEVKTARVPPHFLFVGDGPLYGEIAKFCESLPSSQTTLLRAIPHHEVGQTLALADILVLPSRTRKNWKEQFGRILIEAMGCQVATVGSDSGEIPHLIRQTGGGKVFSEGNTSHLAATLLDLLNQPKVLAELKFQGYQSVQREFTHIKVAQRLADILEL